jgi:predicted glycoside hydrolase/deacetylase ChbG (UPF0249 family)
MHLINRIKKKYFPALSEQLGFSDKDVIVIVNIDDIGMHNDELEASFRTLDFGIVKSGSIMVPCPLFDQVISLWKKNPEADLGIHLTLTCEWGEKYPWTPILGKTDVPSLYNPEGIMWKNVTELLLHAKRDDMKRELEAQITKVLDTGLKPTHLDDHMDLHNHFDLFSLLMELSRKYYLPMRVWKRRRYKYPLLKNNLVSLRKKGFVFPDSQKGFYYMEGQDQSYAFRKAKYYDHLRSLKPGVHNIKIHVAVRSDELQKIMGQHYSSVRQIDYDIWSSDETKDLANDLGIIFIGYRPLQRLQEEKMLRHLVKKR